MGDKFEAREKRILFKEYVRKVNITQGNVKKVNILRKECNDENGTLEILLNHLNILQPKRP